MAFIRVKDPESGHEFDVPESDWRIKAGIFKPVREGRVVPYPTRPKFHVASKGVASKPSSAAAKKEGSK